MADKKKVYTGTGRRKTSVARVRLTAGTGKITINGRDVNEYFPYPTLVMDLTQPLDVTNTRDMFDVDADVTGGGFSGQTGAVRLGITRALVLHNLVNVNLLFLKYCLISTFYFCIDFDICLCYYIYKT